MTKAFAQKIITESNIATGVKHIRKGKESIAYAKKEVIICCGTIKSPHLLMLSGIGDENYLKSFGIDLVCNSKGAGHNLKDHYLFPIAHSLKQVKSLNSQLSGMSLVNTAFQYMASKSGPLSVGAVNHGGFAALDDAKNRSDLQFYVISL